MSPPHDSPTSRRRHREVLGLLAAASAAPPPPDLRARVMVGASARRAPGVATSTTVPSTPPEVFATTVDRLEELLAGLSGDEWLRVVDVYGWSVKELIAHLTAIDTYLASILGLCEPIHDPALAEDHLVMTHHAVAASADASTQEVFASWTAGAHRLAEHLASLDAAGLARRTKFHYLDTRLSTIVMTRVFEIWTHTEDVGRTVGRHAPSPGASELRPMTQLAVSAISLGMALHGDGAPGEVARVVLTGTGGGVFLQTLGFGERLSAESPEPSVTIVADALDFCRLAAQRLAVDALDATFEGDVELGRRVLVGAAVFAA